jgi:hypothetical protein
VIGERHVEITAARSECEAFPPGSSVKPDGPQGARLSRPRAASGLLLLLLLLVVVEQLVATAAAACEIAGRDRRMYSGSVIAARALRTATPTASWLSASPL